MATNKKPKRKYKPRPEFDPRLGNGLIVIPPVFRYSPEAETNLKFIPQIELSKFRDGEADERTYHTLAFRINFGYVLAGEHFPDARPEMEAALKAIAEVWRRHERTGQWGCTNPEFLLMGDALKFTDQMELQTTRMQHREASYIVIKVNERNQRELCSN